MQRNEMECSNIASNKRSVPPGILLSRKVRGRNFRFEFYKGIVLVVTFIAYGCYHASRKPPSIVKSVLHPETSTLTAAAAAAGGGGANNDSDSHGWPPFNGKDGKARLGEIDVAFLAFYAAGMFFAGHLGDRLDLRLFLTIGMLGSGIFVSLFGMGYWWKIHNLYYFLFVQMMAGLFQATGWPSVVAIVGNWCGKTKRGLIMGIWNAHTSVGNIAGSLIAAAALQYGWGLCFLLPGLLIMFGGFLVYMFLVVEPADVDLPSPYDSEEILPAQDPDPNPNQNQNRHQQQQQQQPPLRISEPSSGGLLGSGSSEDEADEETNLGVLRNRVAEERGRRSASPIRDQPVGFGQAWKIPGVAPFAFCLFFSKLVAYTFLYWLPFYIRHTKVAGKNLSDKTAGNLSTLFDIGGVVGGVLAGHISDHFNARATTAACFVFCAIPSLLLYHLYGAVSMGMNVLLMMLTGMLVNGPYSLITTAVSADLGTHKSLKGDARALATVTAIIDGCGSIGAAVGPFLTGYLSATSWDNVFIMLMLSAFMAGLMLTKLVVSEVSAMRSSSSNDEQGNNLTQGLIYDKASRR